MVSFCRLLLLLLLLCLLPLAPAAGAGFREAGWPLVQLPHQQAEHDAAGLLQHLSSLQQRRSRPKQEFKDKVALVQQRTSALPVELQVADPESLDWLNKIMDALWNHTNSAVQHMVHSEILPMINSKIQDAHWLLQHASLNFTTLDLGSNTPNFNFIKVYNYGAQGLKLHLDMTWDCDATAEVDVKVLDVPLISPGIQHFNLDGEVVVWLDPLIDQFPVVGSAKIYFLQTPHFDFDLTGILNVADWPWLGGVLRDIIKDCLADLMVLPNVVGVNLGTREQGVMQSKANTPTPIGVMRMKPISASGLDSSGGGKCVMYRYGGQVWESEYQEASEDPDNADLYRVDWSGPVADLPVYDSEQELTATVTEDKWWWHRASGFGHLQGLTMSAAHESTGTALPIYTRSLDAKNDATSSDLRGHLTTSFEWLDINQDTTSKAECAASDSKLSVVFLHLGEAMLACNDFTQSCGSVDQVSIRIALGDNGAVAAHTGVHKFSGLPEPPSAEAAAEVSDALAGVVATMALKQMNATEIARLTGLDGGQVTAQLEKVKKGESGAVALTVPAAATKHRAFGVHRSLFVLWNCASVSEQVHLQVFHGDDVIGELQTTLFSNEVQQASYDAPLELGSGLKMQMELHVKSAAAAAAL